MFQRRKKAVLILLTTALAVAGFTSGCHLFDEEEDLDLTIEIDTAGTETETEPETEAQTEAETESETETESQTNEVFISEDGTVRIILPDTTWEVTQDIDEMRVFTSGSDAMINIVHAADAEEMQNVSVMESRDELMESLLSQYPKEDAFEIMSFEERSSSTIQIYEYVVKYNYSTSMWSYSVTYGILAVDEDAAYVVSGTVTDDDEKLLEAVQTSVESFSVLDQSSVFSVLPGIVTNNESDSDSDEENKELSDLTEYASPLTLYASSEVNIREKPSTNAQILDALSAGASVTVTGETPDWFRVNAGGNVGYVSKAFLVYSSQTETDASQSESTAAGTDTTYGTSYTYYTSADVNLRATPSSDGSITGSLSSGSAVTVIGESGDWYMVSVGGATCYVYKSYVTSQQPENVTVDSTQSEAAQTDGNVTVEPVQEETDASGSTYSSSTGMLQGTVTAVSGSTIALQDDNGNTYYIDYGNAGSVEVGSEVSATVDYAQATDSGALYATSVY